MDVDDAIVLVLAVWVTICFILVKTVEVYVTLILIGLLIVTEVAGTFMKPEIKQGLKPAIYFLLFIFFIVVVKKVFEVLR